MKKTFRGLLLVAVLFLAFVLTSCVSVCSHVPGASWRADAENHWKICDSCQLEVNKEAHSYGEWEVVAQAAVGVDGKEVRKCSVCRYYQEKIIPAIVVETGETTGDAVVYAQVPADWTNVNCYYWHNEQGTDNMDPAHKTSWPGVAMTQVDAEQNIWAFIVPAGTANVIFNNGSVQTVDIAYVVGANLYVLSSEAGADGKFTAMVDNYDYSGSLDEIAKYKSKEVVEVTYNTIYVQVPESWPALYLYWWGSNEACAGWPGSQVETLEDAENRIYSIKLPSDATGVVLSNGLGGDANQTEDITPAEGINGYVVTDNGDAKDKVSYHVYKDGEFAEPKVTYYAKLPAEWAAQKAYWWGTSDAPANWPGVDMVLVDAENNIYSIDVVSAVSVLIFNNAAGDQTINLAVKAGANAFVVVPQDGNDTADYYVYADGVLTPFVEAEPQDIVLYVKGTMNGWSDNADYQLVVENNVATITITLEAGDLFKVADSSWANQINFTNLVDTDAAAFKEASSDQNIECLVAGTYVITVHNCNDTNRTATITLAE